MHRDGKFDDPEVRANMSACLRNPDNQSRPNLLCQLGQLRNRQLLHISGRVNRLKNVAHQNLFCSLAHRASRPAQNTVTSSARLNEVTLKYNNPCILHSLHLSPQVLDILSQPSSSRVSSQVYEFSRKRESPSRSDRWPSVLERFVWPDA